MRWSVSFAAACLLGSSVLAACAKSASGTAGSLQTTAATSGSAKVAGVSARPDPSRGRQLFERNCMGCHGENGEGGGIGPSLEDEKSRKDFKAVVAWVEDPKPPMPKLFPQPLGERDVDDVAAYLETL